MGFKDITDGEKIAKPIGCRLIETEGKEGKDKKQAIEVEFEFEEPSTGNPERLSWQGWLSPAALDRTMDTMKNVLGMTPAKYEAAKKSGDLNQAINLDGEVKLVVELEEYEGKSRPKIKWVNRIGGSGFTGLSAEVVKTTFASDAIAKAFASAGQDQKAKAEDHKPAKKGGKLPF